MKDLISVLLLGTIGWVFAFGLAVFAYQFLPALSDKPDIANLQPRLELADAH